MARFFEEGYEPKESNPIEDIKQVVEEKKTCLEKPLFVPAEQKDMFEQAADMAREAGIYVPPIEGVVRKEKEQ